MASVESSPSVRRSNSYRVALRKSGISKEYIEELDKMLSDEGVEHVSSVNTESTVIEKPKTKLFKRNYRGNKKSNAISSSITANDTQMTKNEPICINSSNENDTVEMKNGEVTSATMDQGDNYSDDEYYHKKTLPETPDKSTSCKHLLCLICCCNYCAILSTSSRSIKTS